MVETPIRRSGGAGFDSHPGHATSLGKNFTHTFLKDTLAFEGWGVKAGFHRLQCILGYEGWTVRDLSISCIWLVWRLQNLSIIWNGKTTWPKRGWKTGRKTLLSIFYTDKWAICCHWNFLLLEHVAKFWWKIHSQLIRSTQSVILSQLIK